MKQNRTKPPEVEAAISRDEAMSCQSAAILAELAPRLIAHDRAPIQPTDERVSRGLEEGMEFVSTKTEDAGIFKIEGRHATVISRYLKRREITTRMHDAGQKLLTDWSLWNGHPRVIGAYSDMVSNGSVPLLHATERRLAAGVRYDRAIAAIGPAAREEVIDACIWDKAVGVPGIHFLRRGLTLLADHYRLTN